MKRVGVSIAMVAIGLLLCWPAIRIFWWLTTSGQSDFNIAGIDIALLASAIGGAMLTGAAWVFSGRGETP
jgi:hypothetical protein